MTGYFSDKHQVMPKHGYSAMFARMVAHPAITVMLQADYRDMRDVVPIVA